MSYESAESGLEKIDPEVLGERVRVISALAADPVFAQLVREIDDAPEDTRMDTAERLSRVEVLRERGLTVPEGLRLTTRYFEDPAQNVYGSLLVDRPSDEAASEPEKTLFELHVCVSLGYFACVTVGH